ncbi:uncharacterized protein EMH_0059240 [Eimeria mitis]|uniref:Uncharacterized protein n=1 Tax=Eimeria mitis TaxID=44415 RepID=U6KBB5_9EIME|nr:uncharacterized protein EMH_0059240 [Eimeria mitis]CDJ34091.1 hypothetical protein, conserved [Eimeria mitis]
MAQPKSLRSQRMKRPEEARGDSVAAQRMGLSPSSPRGEKRDSSSEGKGPPSRALSSKITPGGKPQKESAVADCANKADAGPAEGHQTPRESQQPPHDGSSSRGDSHADEPSLCPPRDRAQEVCESSSPQGSSGEVKSPHRDPHSGPGLTPVVALEANLQRQITELMRQNALLRQALLKHISREELLFLLAYNTTIVPSYAGDEQSLQDPAHTPRDSTAADASTTEPENNEGEEEQNGRTRNIDLPCVKQFFMAMQCCSRPPHEAPVPSSPFNSLTTCEGNTTSMDSDGYSSIAVDFDPFGMQKEDKEEAETPPVEADSQKSTVPSSTTSTNPQRHAVEGGSLTPLPTLCVGRPPHRATSLGALDSPSPAKPRGAFELTRVAALRQPLHSAGRASFGGRGCMALRTVEEGETNTEKVKVAVELRIRIWEEHSIDSKLDALFAKARAARADGYLSAARLKQNTVRSDARFFTRRSSLVFVVVELAAFVAPYCAAVSPRDEDISNMIPEKEPQQREFLKMGGTDRRGSPAGGGFICSRGSIVLPLSAAAA